jgi:hypothetical protein
MSASRLVLVSLLCLNAAACSVGSTPRTDGSGGDLDGGVRRDGAVNRPDGGFIDPFAPDGSCGSATIPTDRVPGSVLIVFDHSSSMDTAVGGSTRWNLAVDAINNAMSNMPDELSAGLLLFPQGTSECNVPSAPSVPVAPLSTSRAQITAALETANPDGVGTPMYAAIEAGYDYLATLTTPGQRGLIVVSDGANGCDTEDRDAVMMRVADEHAMNGYLAFAVGLDQNNNDLSTIAYNGGTKRNETCLAACTSESCLSDDDCPAGGTCDLPDPIFGIQPPGFCGCETDANCVAPQTCGEDPADSCVPPIPPEFCANLPPATCEGPANCCHYNAAGSTFQADFEAALDQIAQRFLERCVFEVPRGDDPSQFDFQYVNVGVTFTGEEREVLPQRPEGSPENSWFYTDDSHELLQIQGEICEELLQGGAVVEIALGCLTLI